MPRLAGFRKMQQNVWDFLISANSFVQRAGIAALSKEGEEAVESMRQVYDKRQKLMVDLMSGVGFGIPVIPQDGQLGGLHRSVLGVASRPFASRSCFTMSMPSR
jgi:DNA-binding transcriptional MocR family regulator